MIMSMESIETLNRQLAAQARIIKAAESALRTCQRPLVFEDWDFCYKYGKPGYKFDETRVADALRQIEALSVAVG